MAHKITPRPKKARMSKSRIKTMIIVILDIRGIVHCEFVPQGQTVNSAFYLEVLRRLKRRIARVRTDIKDTVKLHHDNATSHTAFIITNFLARSNTPVIPHPPYSPDLAPCDFFLFPRLKREMKGNRGKHPTSCYNVPEKHSCRGLELQFQSDYANFSEPSNSTLLRAMNIERWKAWVNNRAIDDNALVGLLAAYVVLILTGATGNGLVCMAVARKPQMRTARNVFIINLAISDLILCLFTMPFSLVEIVLKFWPLGTLTCKLVAALQATSIFVSTISITAIALDRYKVIIYASPERCRPIISVSYTQICIKLRYRMGRRSTQLQERQERDKKRMRKTNILLVSIALIFGISWLPLNILNIWADISYPFKDDSEFRIVFACCHMVGMSSACSNPLLYGWLNDNFKKEFKEIFSTCCLSVPSNKKPTTTEATYV
ncbi:NPY1R [Cordylochernes scorpioides]|uniref:NPY1R n=1 Tax=Cordylochernes scorpioides TaxID=51811 RepID=A0ABY6KKR7_9ARAC|nr:NPY1R [Cordylochernes scorpioides]